MWYCPDCESLYPEVDHWEEEDGKKYPVCDCGCDLESRDPDAYLDYYKERGLI